MDQQSIQSTAADSAGAGKSITQRATEATKAATDYMSGFFAGFSSSTPKNSAVAPPTQGGRRKKKATKRAKKSSKKTKRAKK